MLKLKEQMDNPWSSLPKTKFNVTSKTVPKVNDGLDPDELEIEISDSESLRNCKLKSLKVKINEKEDDDKELVGHYFYPQNADSDLKFVMNLPEKVQKSIRSYKIQIAIKESSFGLFEKNMFKADISFTSLAASNECTKSFKFDKVKFEVTIRIR